jgi:pimeloyl-ACP methyl ester carboxylesterase
VDYALSRGYHTFSYDRLGIGKSTHGDAKNEIQSFLEIEALAELTRKLRDGSISGINKPSKVVHIGHSFGSAQTVALSAMYPDLSDGLVLTGFSASIASMPIFISGANFQQANLNRPPGCPRTPRPSYSSGYLVNSDIDTNQFLFFYPGNFDEGILAYAEQNKQPMTVGELMSMTGLPAKSSFTGPVYVIDGENDIAFCGGDCTYTTDSSASVPAGVKAAFPEASAFTAYLQPRTGHGINLHYNSTAAYKQINDFLGAQGLMSTNDHEARHHHDF